MVHLFDPDLQAVVFGLLALAFVARTWPTAGESSCEHAERVRNDIRRICTRITPEIGFLLLLSAYRETARAELFDVSYGQGQFVGSVQVRDVFGPATFALLAGVVWLAVRRVGPLGDAPGKPDSSAVMRAWTAWPGRVCFVASAICALVYLGQWTSVRILDTYTTAVFAWEALLAGLLLTGDVRWGGAPGALWRWVERNRAPLALLVCLDALRVTSRASWYLETSWFAPQEGPIQEWLGLFEGRLHDRAGLCASGLLFAAALGAWLVVIPSRSPRRRRDGS